MLANREIFLEPYHQQIMKSLFSLAALAAAFATLSSCAPDKSAEASPVPSPSASAASSAAAAHIFVTTPRGNSARYRIREQLVKVDLPNDAVGVTNGVTGVIATDAKGNIIPAESKFTVDVTTLKSDRDRRDGFVQRRVLETDKYPNVTFVPTSIRGVTLPLPKSGTRALEVTGNLTVRDQTHPVTWKVNATFGGTGVTGTAATAFTFADFGIDQPRVPIVLSVADTIKLEMDFSMGAQK
jgi:polyisoprenoid-binding protein YceI